MNNEAIAKRLDEIAELLEEQGANRFRVQAYRRAASRVRDLPEQLADVERQGGRDALIDLPDIGRGISATIEQLLHTGRAGMLERLRGESEAEKLFASLPGVGPVLAERIHDKLDIDTLEALELAVHDGRLDAVPGIGPAKVEALRSVLAERLGSRRRPTLPPGTAPPPLELILDIDARYRADADAGRLRRIAPRRFNPKHRAWLPIGHYQREGWHFTVLFSNTALAHRLGRTDDWVVVFYYDDDHHEAQCTVVTEQRGPLAGERVVRGREEEQLRRRPAIA